VQSRTAGMRDGWMRLDDAVVDERHGDGLV
jgi:hypothetical protein